MEIKSSPRNILYNTLSPACSSYSSMSARDPLNSLCSLLELQQRHRQNIADGKNNIKPKERSEAGPVQEVLLTPLPPYFTFID